MITKNLSSAVRFSAGLLMAASIATATVSVENVHHSAPVRLSDGSSTSGTTGTTPPPPAPTTPPTGPTGVHGWD